MKFKKYILNYNFLWFIIGNLIFLLSNRVSAGLLDGERIVIDPGHDSRHISYANEQRYTLETAKLLKTYLEQQGAKVYLTRETENCILPKKGSNDKCLGVRNKYTDDKDANYFISLHYNENDEYNLKGSQVYYYPDKDFSEFAQTILDNLTASIGTSPTKEGKGEKVGGGVFKYNLRVLKNINIPAVLVEICGKTAEAGIMTNANGQKKTAEDIANGIMEWIIGNPKGPGGTHPDENESVSSSSSLLSQDPVYYQGRSVVNVLFHGFYRDLNSLLSLNKQPTLLFPIVAGVERLKETPVVIIPSGGLYGLSDSTLFKTQLEEYVKSGGTIICFAQQHGYDFNVLPRGNEIVAYGWLEDQNCQNASVSISVDHPMFAGQSTNTPNVNVDGYFTQYPGDATILLTRTKNLYPAMIMYPYGNGKVIVSSMYTDWAYGHGMASSEEIGIVRDLISWAKNTEKAIPTIQPGQSVIVPVEVKYNLKVGEIQVNATKVVFTIIDPDGNIVTTQEQGINLVPDGVTTVNVNYTSSTNAKRGIWWIDYTLYDANGNIVQEQTEGDRFAVSVVRTPGVIPGAWQMWAVSSSSYVAKGSDIVLTVFIKNNSNQDLVGGSIIYGAHQARAEGGAWWIDLGNIQNVTIPAGTEQRFTFVTRIDYSSSFIFYLFDRPVGGIPYFPEIPAGKIVSTERGVWVVPANVSTTVSTDKTTYKRRDVSNISVNLKNLQNASYNLISQVRIFNPNNVVVFQQNYTINLPANSQSTIPITFGINETIKDGIYVISVETFEGANRVSTGANTFEVQNIKLSLLANIPSTISPDTTNEISFTVINTGIIDVVNAPLTVTLKDPNNAVLYRETKYFNLSVGSSGTISYTIPSFSLDFGNYALTYNVEYGAKLIFGMEVLNSSNSFSLVFDKTVYAVKDTMNMNLKITNTGRFNEVISVNVRVDSIGINDTRSVNILAGQSINVAYNPIIPDETLAGAHKVIVTLSFISSKTETFYFTIPGSKLSFVLDALNYNAGDNVSIKINNTGGINTTADYTISLSDSSGKIISSINGTTGIIGPRAYETINFAIPFGITYGEYVLNVGGNDKVTGEKIALNKILKLSGIKVVLSSKTEKGIYLANEGIAINTNIVNSEREINNASLSFRITAPGKIGEIAGKTKIWTNEVEFQSGELTGVTTGDNPGTIQLIRGYHRDARDFQGISAIPGGFINDWGFYWNASYEQSGSILVANLSDQECHTQFISSYVSSHGDNLPMEIEPGIYTIWLFTGTGNPPGQPNPDKLTVKVGINGATLKVFTPSDTGAWEHIGRTFLDRDSVISVTSHILDHAYIPQIGGIFISTDANYIPDVVVFQEGDKIYFSKSGVARYKFNTGSTVVWNNLSWIADTFYGTKVKFRTRGADTEAELNTAVWSEYTEVSSMPILTNPSQWIEIESILETTNRIKTPVIYEITVTADYPPVVDDSEHKSWKNSDLQTGILENIKVVNNLGMQLKKGYHRDGRDFQGISAIPGGFINDWGFYWNASYEQSGSILVAKVTPDQECHTQFISSYVSSHGDNLPMEIEPGIYTIWLATGTGNPPGQPNLDKLTVKVGINGVTLKVFTPSDTGAWEHIGRIFLDKDSVISVTSNILDQAYIPQIIEIYLTPDVYETPTFPMFGQDGDKFRYAKKGTGIYRFNAQSSVVWKNISWMADTPSGTKVKFRTRIAQSGMELVNAIWSDYYEVSGSVITSNPGQWIEVEANLETTEPLNTPILSSFTLGAENIPAFVVWKKDITITNIPANQTVSINTPVDTLGIGKYYLDTKLSSNITQNISQTVYPFYITDKNVTLTFTTDKKVYKPGENIIITGEAVNLGTEEAKDVNLVLKVADTVIYTETFNIAANSTHPFTVTTTATGSFTLTGIINTTIVSDRVTVEVPKIETIIDAPEIAGREPFNFDVLIKNTGKIDINLTVNITGQIENIFLPVATQKLISKNVTIDRDTVVDTIISGDINQTIQKQIIFGEKALVGLPISLLYPEGTISLGYTVTNTGSLQTTEDINFVLFKNAQQVTTIQKKHIIPVSSSITDTLVLENLVAGTYILKYTTLFETNQLSFNVGKYNTASIRTELGNFNGSAYLLKVFVKNIGVNEFKGTLRITNKFLTAEEEINLLLSEEKVWTYNIVPRGSIGGVFPVKVEVLFAGNTIASETKNITLIGPVFSFINVPNNLIFDAGSTNTLIFRIKNTGDLESQANLKLVVFDTIEQTKQAWLKPNEETDISFTFPVPEDMPDGDYSNIAKVTLNNVETSLKLHINGIKLSVSSSLDKENYIEGETAQFSINVTNLTTGMFNLKAVVQFNEYSESKEFTLSAGTQTLTFPFPVKFTGQKLTYGIYFKDSGRSIYLDSVYINKKQDIVTLTTDKQVYNPGELVTMKIESTQAGTISITAPKYTQTTEISVGTTTLSFTLPSEMIAGTYTIGYTFGGVSYTYRFDVAGYIVRILEAKLDKPKPNPGEIITLSLVSDSNKDITPATLKGWLINAGGITAEAFSENIYLVKGENKFNPQFTVVTTSTGIHRIIYGIYDSADRLLVSGSKSFDVGTATLLGITTEKNDYPLGTEAVNGIVSIFGQSGINTSLTIYLNDNFISTQNITCTGVTQELTIPIQVQTPGWYTVRADLVIDGLISTKGTRFIYGSILPDLTISNTDITIEHPVSEFHGIQYDIEAKVYNIGKQDANNVVVRFYDGDPDSGGLYIGETTIQKITGKGGSGVAKVRWDATWKEGEHTIFVVVNPDNIIRELDTTNNKATKSIRVYKVWLKHWEGDFVGTGSVGGLKDRHKIYNYSTKRLGKVNLVKVTVKALVKGYENDGSQLTDKIDPYLEVWTMEKQKYEKGKWKCFRFGRWQDTHQINGSITPIDIGWYTFRSTDPEVLSDIADEKHDHIDLWIRSLDAGKSEVKHSKDKVKIDKVILEIEYE